MKFILRAKKFADTLINKTGANVGITMIVKQRVKANEIDKMELVGNIKGKKILHLQCHFGQDTMTFSRMGAFATGVDFSEKALKNFKLRVPEFPDSQMICDNFFNIDGVEPYKTYKIGRLPKSSTDWKTVDDRFQGVINFGNWKSIWSYEHPRSWNELNSSQIVDDILGL